MKNRLVLVTGSAKGLGFAIAKTIAEQGCRIILTGRNQVELDVAVQKLPHPGLHITYCADLTNEQQVGDFYQYLLSKGDEFLPDSIVHNIGAALTSGFPLKVADLINNLQVNLFGAMQLNELLLPHMQKSKFGRVVHISSDASITVKSSPAYAIAKAAVNSYVKTQAKFYAKANIMFCGVLPGILEHETSIWSKRKTEDPEKYKNAVAMQPLGRFGSADEVAEVVSSLICSKNMLVTGSLIELTGANL